MPNLEDITDPTTAMNMSLALMVKAFKLNYSTPTNNNQRISSNLRIRFFRMQIRTQEFRKLEIKMGELLFRGMLIRIGMQASTSGTQTNKAPVYDSDGSAEYTELLKPIPEPHQVPQNDNNVLYEVFSVEQSGGTVEQHPVNVEETHNTRTRKPHPRSNTKNDRVPSASKSSTNKNKEVEIEVEEHHRKLLLSRNKKHMSSECNNVKLATQNVKYKVVCDMCKKCLISVNHDECLFNYVNGMTSRGKKQKANVSINEKQKKQQPKVKKTKKVWSIKRLASPKPSIPRSFLRWSPTRRLFDLKGKIIASSKLESQSDCSKGDNACTSNPLEPTIKRFLNPTFSLKFLGTVRFINDHIAGILGFNDLQCGNILTTRVYFIEGLGHNLFSVGQFCDSDLERYVLMIVDDYSRYTWVHFLISKDEAPEVIKTFLKRITVLLQFPVIIIRTDNDTKFKNQNDREDIGKLGAKGDIGFFIGYSADFRAYRVFNRRTKKIMEIMNVSGLDLTYAPSTITSQPPTDGELDLLFEAMYDDYIGGQLLAALRTVSAALAHQVCQTPMTSTSIADNAPTPTSSSSQATIFPNTLNDVDGLNSQQQHAQQQGNQAPIQLKIIADNILNAMFDEKSFVNPFANPSTKQVIGEPSRPVLTRNQLRSDGDMCMYALTVSTIEPKNIKEAMTDPAWIESMQEELLQFKRLDVWVLVPAPDNVTPLTLKWLFKNKHDEEKMVIRNKSRLVVRGYRQEEGTDFKESFPSVARMEAIRSNYVLEILIKYGMESCDPVGTPMEMKDKLELDQNGTPVDATKYRSMIGALMYLTSSRPDIVHATCLCARYQAKPTEKHLKEVKRSFAISVEPLIWVFGIQRIQLTDYGFHFNKIPIYCDSKSAISISYNPVQHSRTKHIVVRYHFIKAHMEKGTIELYFAKTDYQLADLFTNALPVDRFNYLVCRLGMRSLSPQELDRLAKS
nr:hypothetical protein [Tanacetum cinerariifolium]